MYNYISEFVDFDSFFEFLYKKYLSRIVFGLVYFLGWKTKASINILNLISFTKSAKELKLLV
jgi:hypothetical protein